MTSHLVPLERGWALWKVFRVRGAGFPVDDVLALGDSELAAIDDRRASLDAGIEGQRARAVEALRALRADPDSERNRLSRAIRRVRSGRAGEAIADAFAAADQVAELAGQETALAEVVAAFERRFETATGACSATLREVAAEPRFREALAWQNRRVLHTGVASLLRAPVGATDKKTRKRERLVASYLQRYCTKNDTIGFFGPFGWGSVGGERPYVAEPGAELIAGRELYFEYWAVDALAESLADDAELKPHMIPRRSPKIWIDGVVLHHPIDRRTELPGELAAVLQLVDGARTAAEIATELRAFSAGEVYDLLAELEEQAVISWTLELPTATARPERALRELVRPSATASAAVAELEAGRERLVAAAGDADAVDWGLAELEATFAKLTGRSPRRAGGETYAGRTITFEECRRDLSFTLGAPLVEAIAGPLVLLLTSARWYTYEIARRFRAGFREIYHAERDATGESAVDFLRFWRGARELFDGGGGIVAGVLSELHDKWRGLLDLDASSDRRISLTTAALRSAVAGAFAAPHPGWPGARHHSPDLLIATPPGGELLVVLGELHTGMNTVSAPVAIKEYPDPDELIAARESDLPDPCIAPTWSRARNRADFYSVSRHDYDLEMGEGKSARSRDRVLAAAELVIEASGEQLIVRSRARDVRFEVVALLEQHLLAESFAEFDLCGRRPHTPRISIDGVVVCRERWDIDCLDFVATGAKSPAELRAVRAWARERGMPRFVFAKTNTEVKPFYVDFASPILVDIFARNLKRADRVVISEMLPSIDQCWLPDAAGRTYTSELRLVALDPEPWRPPGVR